jgi:hypothetical protein
MPAPPAAQSVRSLLAPLRERAGRLAYGLVAAACVLIAARRFYGELLAQTGGEWSAPLDDVFIHFDYARSIARGYPFEWSEGNGFSSGNTSLTYPFVLAFGYWIGFRDVALMLWAAIVACACVLALLLAAERLARGLPRWARLLVPPCLLSLGALDWSLFSGMEVAFLLAVWSVALGFALDHRDCGSLSLAPLGWKLGVAGALVVATRPEGATSVAVLGCAAAWLAWRSHGSARRAAAVLLRAGAPALALLACQLALDAWLTGDATPSGAIVKLALNNPYMTPSEKWQEYWFHLRYCLYRNVEHHFADAKPWGWIPVALALVALVSRRTRTAAALLVASSVTFVLVVAANGQVRWQNERYTMPAVAWLFVAASLGMGVLLARGHGSLARLTRLPRAALAVALAALFVKHQAPKMADQIWFFGRASRNIRDQHITAGRLLRKLRNPPATRVAVGDAGALMYASDLPGLDIIGLGGFRNLPFARASVHGLGATVELLERLPKQDLPNYLAIYPGWWGELPVWFGIHRTSVWVEGNVICGGAEKAIYEARWTALGTGSRPLTLRAGERVADEVDVADLVSEDEHRYELPRPSAGFVEMRLLPDAASPKRDVLDAGRHIPQDRSETFVMRRPSPGKTARLVARTPPARSGRVEVEIDGNRVGAFEVEAFDGWQEPTLPLVRLERADGPMKVRLTPRGMPEWVDHHVWLVEEI